MQQQASGPALIQDSSSDSDSEGRPRWVTPPGRLPLPKYPESYPDPQGLLYELNTMLLYGHGALRRHLDEFALEDKMEAEAAAAAAALKRKSEPDEGDNQPPMKHAKLDNDAISDEMGQMETTDQNLNIPKQKMGHDFAADVGDCPAPEEVKCSAVVELMEGLDDVAVKKYHVQPKAIEIEQVKKVEVFLPQKVGATGVDTGDTIDRLGLGMLELEVTTKIEQCVESTTRPTPIPMSSDLVADLFRISDSTFFMVMSTFGSKLGHENLCILVDYVIGIELQEPGVNDEKIKAILHHGFLPQMAASSRSIRFLANSYMKLLECKEDLVMDQLYVPLLLSKGVLIRSMFSNVNTRKLLAKVLAYVIEHSLILEGHTLAVVGFCLEKEKTLSACAVGALFHSLKRSSGYGMSQELGAFYFFLIRRFLLTFRLDELQMLHSLNNYNGAVGKDVIDKMMQGRIQELLAAGQSPVPTNYQMCVWNPENASLTKYMNVQHCDCTNGNGGPVQPQFPTISGNDQEDDLVCQMEED